MRIVQMLKSLGTGGIEAMVCGLSNQLVKENDVTVCTIVTPSPGDKFYRELAPAITRKTIGRTGDGKPMMEMLRIARFIRNGGFDIVHVHGFFYYFALAILLFHGKTCFCYTVHSNALKENNPWDLRILPFKRFCFRRGWVHPVTISPSSQQSFVELYGCPGKMIPNGVTCPRPPKDKGLALYRITEKTKVFLHASRICPEKNQVMLCRVFDQLIREGNDIVLILAGPIHHHDIFDDMKVFFSDRIQYIGDRDDIPALLCTADGMCLTSYYEGMPVILLEALAAGCIPICTPVGGIMDVVKDGENGVLSEDVSEQSYYRALNKFLQQSEDSIKGMKAASLQTARQYDIVQVGLNYQAYFNELLRK